MMLSSKRVLAIISLMLCLTACAKGKPQHYTNSVSNKHSICTGDNCYVKEMRIHDPWEKFNRANFRLNQHLDKFIFTPVDGIYTHTVPPYARSMVRSFLHNLTEPLSFLNAILQLDPKKASQALGRFLTNSTWGVGGLYDVAGSAGIKHNPQSLGKNTLRAYGAKPGPYLVLPVLGPSTVRDISGMAADWVMDPWFWTASSKAKNLRLAAKVIDDKNEGLAITDYVHSTALDEYVALRNLYWQKYE